MKFDRTILKQLTVNITDGEHASVNDDPNGDFFLLSNKNIIKGYIKYDDSDRKISKQTFDKISKRTKLQKNDVVLSTVGTIGKVAIIRDDKIVYDFQRSVGIIKCDINKLIPEYLYYYFNQNFVQKRLVNVSKGAVQKCLFINDLENLLIDYPKDTKHQLKIIEILQALDSKIELNNRINAELEAMAKTLYDYWFVQFDFPNANGKPYKTNGGKMVWNDELKREVPEGWEVCKVDDYAEIKKGELITAKDAEQGNVKVVAAGVDYSYLHSTPNRLKNTITISGSGANAGFINFWREPIFASDCITVRGKSDTETLILLQYLNFIQPHILSQATGSAQPHVYPSDIKVLNYVVPPDLLVENYGKMTIPMNEKIGNNLTENQKLTELRDWLLPMLMNGQVRVSEL